MFKKNFLFIIIISTITLVALVIGAMALYKDNSEVFLNDGYIIETTKEANAKYYFSANTKYKENVEEKISFEDKKNNKVAVDPASFIHYANGNIAFLKKGALVNLSDITAPMVSYYNITNDNVIIYEQNHYVVTSNNKKIDIDSFVGRINDNKFIIAGDNLTLRIPTESAPIMGEYFEINYIEEGIAKIDNEEHSYQVTAQDSYIYIGDNIIINLGDGKISYDNDVKMLLSQITINGDENINLDVPEINGGGGSGSGESNGDGSGEGGSEGDGNETGEGDSTGEGSGEGTGDGNGNGPSDTTANLLIELTKAEVSSTAINLTMQLNNANLAKGKVIAYLTNVATGKKEPERIIDLSNGTFNLNYSALVPNTNYSLTIAETNSQSEIQYFQKNFITKELGLTLEKIYATEDTLAYKLNFDNNSEVTKARITIYDNNGTNDNIKPNEYEITANDIDSTFYFEGLKSNTSYSIKVDTVWIDKTAYNNIYTISRIDTTLKETPKISGVSVEPNAEEVKFTISLANVIDKDESIISYTYNVYLADDITLENLNPEVQYSITKTDSDPLVLNLNEINELKTGVDYRCKIVAKYNDNEMIREVSTDYSSNFLIKSKPNISFELKSATMNKVEGTITLIDANCTVPIKGRVCSNKDNTFTLRYYELSEEETTDNDTLITFDTNKLTSELTLTDLKSNTTYAVKVFGNYYDDDNVLHSNVQIGDAFYVTTDKSENIYFEVAGDNISGLNKDGTENLANVVTFDAKLTAPQDSNIIEEISTITLNLYSGRYNTKDKLIGTYTIKDRTTIEDFFNNKTITNSLFTDTTQNNLGKLDSILDLITVTNNSTGTLNSSYTVEVENVYDSTGINKITVENNIYTFNLTPSYYLDARIATNPNSAYVTVTPITKIQLQADTQEYDKLLKNVPNLGDLNDQTVVGLTVENSLSDIFVDSAYNYEKATVYYTICNETINDCDKILKDLTDNNPDNDEEAKSKIKLQKIDMGNKYQPKSQTFYLDSSEKTNAKKYFIRGYKYLVGFYIDFSMEDGSTPKYTNDKLHELLPIERQNPIYTQYISTSDESSITYRYSFRDVDSALADNNFYYTIGDKEDKYHKVEKSLIDNYDQKDKENTYNNVTLPISERNKYTLYYARKNTDDEIEYVEMTNNYFEGKYTYNDSNAYTILNEASNSIKIKLANIDVTNRAIVYKVVIDSDETDETPYIKYFLSSKLDKITENTGNFDEKGEPITKDYKYIAIDYAQINRFMGYKVKVTVTSYFANGLIGYNQNVNNGFVLKNNTTDKFLNIYNNESNDTSSIEENNSSMGLYLLKEPYEQDSDSIFIYNHLMKTKDYDSSKGASYYNTKELGPKIGIKFQIAPFNGMELRYGTKNYTGYDLKVLDAVELKTTDNTHKFDTIVPTIKVTDDRNTINSIIVDITTSGIYGNKQFTDENAQIKLYSDPECTNEIESLNAKIKITGNDDDGYEATINSVEFKNLKPDTKYYIKVFAYVNKKLTQLYDYSSKATYIAKTYESKTLGGTGIISEIDFHVKPIGYSGATSTKAIKWRVNLKNTQNYKLRFELFEPNGTVEETDPETGEKITKTTYKSVKFNGNNGTSCPSNISSEGNKANGYITNDNCYIIVNEANLVDDVTQTYTFSGEDDENDSFVFGGKYYKLLVYAIPYTNNKYVEEDKVLLYQNDSLTSTEGQQIVNGIIPSIKIPKLEEAKLTIEGLTTGFISKEEGYFISFYPKVEDEYNVIEGGSYTIKLKNENDDDVKVLTDVTYDINDIQGQAMFTNLSGNTPYYIELSYDAYMNNVNYTEIQKQTTTPFTDFLYTPISNNITLGAMTATQSGATGVTLTYNGSANLNQIVKVEYTISLLKGGNTTSGTYTLNRDPQTDVDNIFVVSTDKAPRFTINTSLSNHSSNTGFTFKTGNTYVIRTIYTYLENGKEVTLQDQVTGNTTYTTILNL